jgi:uncharacterized membrane protein
MEELLRETAAAVALAVEAAAVAVVAIGAIGAAAGLIRVAVQGAGHGVRKAVWRGFGLWLLLGLEFELAADIIRSVIAPTWKEIGELGAIAVIRTFLNYFLEKDLEGSAEPVAVRASAADRDGGQRQVEGAAEPRA